MDEKLLPYFIDQTNERFNKLDSRFDSVDSKLQELITFRMVLIGASVGVSGMFSVAVTLITLWFMRKGG